MWYNVPIRWLLRSPLHSMLSANVLLITYLGRRSGKTYATPVNYVRDGDILSVVSFRHRTWWRNLQSGVPVSLRLRGHERKAVATVFTDDEAVAASLLAHLQRAPQYAKYFRVTLDPDGKPDPEEARKAADSRIMVRIELTEEGDRP